MAVLILVTLILAPATVAPQHTSRVAWADVSLNASRDVCVQRERHEDPAWSVVESVFRAPDPGVWRSRVRALEDSLALEATERPTDLPTQYLYAAVLGARTEVEGGRKQVSKAIALHRQVGRVLALDPAHPGAHYIQGRLNAAVMRLGGLKRFIATKLLGGGALSSASWTKARRFLELAADGDPCVPEHHFELARVYAETGDRGLAVDELALALSLIPEGEDDQKVARKAKALQRKLGVTGGDGTGS